MSSSIPAKKAERHSGRLHTLLTVATTAATLLLAHTALTTPALAQSGMAANGLSANRQVDPNARMLVRADQLEYDSKRETVSAVGNVEIYYDGATLQADRVELVRTTNRVRAIGNVRLTDRDGKIVTSQNLDLTQDYSEGFIDSLRLDTPDNTHFAAARADRTEGNVTIFQNGVYTACEPCKENPEKPPLWQIKAKRIIHDQEERMIYYENAKLEFFGLPIAYLPFMSTPDPTVKRKTGFLFPQFFGSSQIGYGAGIPFFWNIAPDRDITLTPAYISKQGFLMQGEWRQRLINGSYSIRASGIIQQDKDQFLSGGVTPLPGYRDQRGAIETSGSFMLNPFWNFGWDATLVSDRTYLRDYSLAPTGDLTRTSTIYLTGQRDQSYFDLRGLYFLGMTVTDNEKLLPFVGTLNYDRDFSNSLWGGVTNLNVNVTSLTRDKANFVGMWEEDSYSGATGIPTGTCLLANPNPEECLLRGIPGDYTRASAELSWKKTITDDAGQMWTPFASARVDVASVNVESLPYAYQYGPTFNGQNPMQSGSDSLIRAMPVVGLDYQYPFISVEEWGVQTLIPRAQMVIRPDETDIGRFPNEDAQSLVFDDTNLFEVNKYSGYDRVEGGGRLNLGLTYNAALNNGGKISALVGQSYHLFGKNSFANGDMANTGLESGLETDASDYIARVAFSPTRNLDLVTRFRFDNDNFELQRFELQGRAKVDRLDVTATYGRYDAQPLLGYYDRREGVYTTASYKLTDTWSLRGALRYNLVESGIDYSLIGLRYLDDCFTLGVNFVSDYSLDGPDGQRVDKVMVTIGLRTLGEGGFSTSVGGSD
ncbi:MAG: LPS-assembly protein LptD [Xanthobacter sp.]